MKQREKELKKANELRIGNWIKDGDYFEQVTIGHLNCLTNGICIFIAIPLTEEWLLKFGFKKEVEGFYIHYDMIECISLKFHFDGWYIEDNDRGFINTKPIKYVHQLQNLYFALTEDELSFKPE